MNSAAQPVALGLLLPVVGVRHKACITAFPLLAITHSTPQALITGTATLGDGKGKRDVRGTAWIEHQWGNFRGPSHLHSRYQWAWARFDNGDLMTYR